MNTSKRRRVLSALIAIIGVSAFSSCDWMSTEGQAGAGTVDLGSAADFVILAKTGVSSVPASDVTGDIGLSPAATSYLTGFDLTDATGYATASQVTGKLYASDMAPPTPEKLTTAVSDMEDAYVDAAGRTDPDELNLNDGHIGGLTLEPGLYTWGTTVTIPTDVTISGNSADTWVFQVAGDLTVAAGAEVILSGGAQAKNLVWQVAGIATLGAGADFSGIILSQTEIVMETGAVFRGRALAQSQVALDQAVVTEP